MRIANKRWLLLEVEVDWAMRFIAKKMKDHVLKNP